MFGAVPSNRADKTENYFHPWLHPITLGVGQKVFDGGAVPTNVALVRPPVARPSGTLRYGLAAGTQVRAT